jgi:thiol-disulfide isomerase/thioredoxin
MYSRPSSNGSKAHVICLVGLTALLAAGSLTAQSPTGQRQTGFALIDDYILEVGGTPSKGASLYASSQTRAILVVSQDLPAPVLLWPRSRRVETLQMLKVARRPGGTAEILPDPVIAVHAPFVIDTPNLNFLVDGVAAALTPKPALLGLHGVTAMTEYSSVYGQRAEAYVPQDELVEKLSQQDKSVRVRVFFGSWCPACGQMVPRIMKVAQRLGAESMIQVEFYGLPKGAGFSADPEVKKYGITQVPTGVVLVDGKEIGRISGDQWRSPEGTLSSLLGVS